MKSMWCEIKQAPNLRIFERRLDQYWTQHGLKYNFRGVVNCSPIANQWTNKGDTKEDGVADDLDIYALWPASRNPISTSVHNVNPFNHLASPDTLVTLTP